VVYFEDMGTAIDLPLDELEALLETEEHGSAHAEDVRNFQVVETVGPTIVLAYERRFEGRWRKAKTRLTAFPPYCRCVEDLEGDFAGTRFFVLHRPDGERTRVDVFGDVRGPSKSPEQLRRLWLDILAKAHEEDLATLRKLRGRK